MRYFFSAVGLVIAMAMIPVRIISAQPSKDGEKVTGKASRHNDDWFRDAYGQDPVPFYRNPFASPPNRIPYPYHPFRFGGFNNDALFPGRYTFGSYVAPGQISLFGLPPINVVSAKTSAPQVPLQATTGSGGTIPVGTYCLAVVSIDSDGRKSMPSSLISAVILVAGGTVTIPNVVFDSGAVSWELYMGPDNLHMWKVASDVVANPVTAGASDLDDDNIGLPDVKVNNFRVIVTPIRHGGIWGAGVASNTSTTLKVASTVTLDQWAGRVISLYGSVYVINSGGVGDATYDGLSPVTPNNWNVTGNSTSGVMTISPQFLTETGHSGGLVLSLTGDAVVMRAQANIASANTIGDSAFVNFFAPTGLATNSEYGKIVWIIFGTGAGQKATINSNTSTTLTINGAWDVIPDATSIFIILEDSPAVTIECAPFQNDGVGVTDMSIAAIKSLPFTVQGSQSFLVQVVTEDANGNISPVAYAPWSEVFVPMVVAPQTVVGFLSTGVGTGTNIGPIMPAAHDGNATKCVFVTKTSDASIPLTFDILQNGVSVFASGPQTIAAATAGGTTTVITALTSAPLPVAALDKFTLNISSGSTSWQFTVQLTT